jgi:large subunit ribosomal protein L17
MRHRNKGRKLNRTASHRKALLRNLANQLIEHKEIRTTTEKAKEARSTVERLITYAKKGDIHHRRLAFGFLRNKESIKILFDEIAPAFAERQGGYTRVLKLGRRQGDSASLSLLQLVGFEKLSDTSAKSDKKKKAKKGETKEKSAEDKKAAVKAEKVEDIPEAEVVEEVTEKEEVEKKPESAETEKAEGTEEIKPESAPDEEKQTDQESEETEDKK